MPAQRKRVDPNFPGSHDQGKWHCTAKNTPCKCNSCLEAHPIVCPHSYKNRGELVTHHQSAHGIESGVSLTCQHGCVNGEGQPEAFTNQANLRRHIRDSHPTMADKFVCPECNRPLGSRTDNIRRHFMGIHKMSKEAADELLRGLKAIARQPEGDEQQQQLQPPSQDVAVSPLNSWSPNQDASLIGSQSTGNHFQELLAPTSVPFYPVDDAQLAALLGSVGTGSDQTLNGSRNSTVDSMEGPTLVQDWSPDQLPPAIASIDPAFFENDTPEFGLKTEELI